MRFEKWQALGNDYLIVEERELPFELTAERISRLCSPHTGVGADGVLLLSNPEQAGCVARMRVFNPDGSEAELSGNGAREAILYLRHRGWTDEDSFAIQTAAGEIRSRITSAKTCVVEMGRARLQSDDYPDGGPDGTGALAVGEKAMPFRHVQVGNPQCVFFVPDEEALDSLDLAEIGPVVERSRLFPNRTNASWYAVLGPGRIRARIFERGVGETSASGTGATGAAVAYVQSGGPSPVTVVLDGGELEVEVGQDLRIQLTGWAVPVFSGSLSHDFTEELHATQ